MSPYLIAITGGSGSGKSTLTTAFQAHLGAEKCVVMGEDNYYKARADHDQDVVGLPHDEVEKIINFDDFASKDMPAMRADIEALKAGKTIHQPVYSFADHDRITGQFVTLVPKPVIIVEGIHVLSVPEIAALFDLTVFVDTPADLRLARRIKRDIIPKSEGGRGRDPDRVISQYLQFVRATHQRQTEPSKYICDLVIADEGMPAYREIAAEPTKRAINRMLAPLLNRVHMERPDLVYEDW